jgi:hypothetical protein
MRGHRQGQMIQGFHDAIPLYDYSGLAVETGSFAGLAVELGGLDDAVDAAFSKIAALPTLAKAGALVLLGVGGYVGAKHLMKSVKGKTRANGRRRKSGARRRRVARRNRR